MEYNDCQITNLTLKEKCEINGGLFWIPLALIACTVIIEDWDNFKAGLAGKPEVSQ